MKVAAAFLIAQMLASEEISQHNFKVDDLSTMPFRGDIWLWSKLRRSVPSDQLSILLKQAFTSCLKAVLYRDNSLVTPLWKNRAEYHETTEPLKARLKKAGQDDTLDPNPFNRKYESWLSDRLQIISVLHWLKFKPVTDSLTPLTDEYGKAECGHLRASSPLTNALLDVWEGEPPFYIVCLGSLGANASERRKKMKRLRKEWVNITFDWISQEQPASSTH